MLRVNKVSVKNVIHGKLEKEEFDEFVYFPFLLGKPRCIEVQKVDKG